MEKNRFSLDLNIKEYIYQSFFLNGVWFALLILAVWSYQPGLTGWFLLDDFANLQVLGASPGGVHNWETFWTYLTGGFSGPTGRPVSLLSFLMDAQNWPADSAPFKKTSLLIHLASATVLWRLLRCMLRQMAAPKYEVIALVAASIWLLHPFLLSTTLYVVQRMTQLSAFFVLVGLWGYLHGREQFGINPVKSYLWMSASITIGTVIAVFSKENGALLPLLAFIIEWVMRAHTPKPQPGRVWVCIFMFLPSLAVLGYLALRIDFSPDLWPHRNFNQIERLWTESRILWDYIFNLLAPAIERQGLIRDDFIVSRGWMDPPTTLPSVIGIISLLISGVFFRRCFPLLSLALLFFLAGHVMESSVVGLELYFEHRNYLPSALLFLPLGSLIGWLDSKKKKLSLLASISVMIFMAFLLHQRAFLWSDTEFLETYWAMNRPYSIRSHIYVAEKMMEGKKTLEADAYLEDANRIITDSSALKILWLLNRIDMNNANQADFKEVANFIRSHRIDSQVTTGLILLDYRVRDVPVNEEHVKGVLEIVKAIKDNPGLKKSFPHLVKMVDLSHASLLLSLKKWQEARNQMVIAMREMDDTDEALDIVTGIAAMNRQQDALSLIPYLRDILDRQPRWRMLRSKEEYLRKIDDLERKLREDLVEQE